MMIGNILSRTRSSPAKMPILLLALLLKLPKFTGESARANEAHRLTNADILVLSSILSWHHYSRFPEKEW